MTMESRASNTDLLAPYFLVISRRSVSVEIDSSIFLLNLASRGTLDLNGDVLVEPRAVRRVVQIEDDFYHFWRK